MANIKIEKTIYEDEFKQIIKEAIFKNIDIGRPFKIEDIHIDYSKIQSVLPCIRATLEIYDK